MKKFRNLGLSTLLVAAVTSLVWFQWIQPPPKRMVSSKISYIKDVQPILTNNCVACHSCYNGPCQLNLGSWEGLQRGASKIKMFNPNRPTGNVKPTRLFTDHNTEEEWRENGFFSVKGTSSANSLLYDLVQARRESTDSQNRDTFQDHLSKRSCLDTEEAGKLDSASKASLMAMPYHLPALSDDDMNTLEHWVSEGAQGPSEEELAQLRTPSPEDRRSIHQWEQFLNGDPDEAEFKKEQLVGRYIYEHFFLGHFYFQDSPNSFYRLVRSKEKEGYPVTEIATRHPHDSPYPKVSKKKKTVNFFKNILSWLQIGNTPHSNKPDPFYYRFKRVNDVIVHKTHITMKLTDDKRYYYRSLFHEPDYTVSELPSYDKEVAANPFDSFKEIPAKSRYKFLLDEARYFVMNFIRGPVCRGQAALNVINDHFNAFFMDPDKDPTVNIPDYYDKKMIKSLQMPGVRGSDLFITKLLSVIRKGGGSLGKELDYLELRDQKFKDAGYTSFSVDDIWKGGPELNKNALLTIVRNYDSATVEHAQKGSIPKTIFMFDYTVLERTYYSLVASFDPYGAAAHQLLTRLYFGRLRLEGEEIFLSMIEDKEKRNSNYSHWHRNIKGVVSKSVVKRMKARTFYDGHPVDLEAPIEKESIRTKENTIEEVVMSMPPEVRGELDSINWKAERETINYNFLIRDKTMLEHAFRGISSRKFFMLHNFPEITYIRVKLGGDPMDDLVYTMIRNKGHLNVDQVFQEKIDAREDSSLAPHEDTLHFHKGFIGSYPNLYLEFSMDQASEAIVDLFRFLEPRKYEVESLTDIWTQADEVNAKRGALQEMVRKYAISRYNPDFWEHHQWFNEKFKSSRPIEAGLFDLNRYGNY